MRNSLTGTRVAVVGLGTVGAELAAALSAAGAEVVGIEIDAGRAAAVTADTGLVPDTRLTAAAGCDVVIEAVPERLAVKRQVLTELAAVCGPAAVAVVTALALPFTDVVAGTGWTDRACGVRYAGPLAAVRLVELVRPAGAVRAGDRVAAVFGALGRRVRTTDSVDRVPVPVALLMRLLNESASMHDQGYASAADIDTAMRLGCGWRDGPLRMLDEIGLDCALDVLDVLADRTGREVFTAAPGLRRLVAAGNLGVKTGAGFHPHPAPEAPAPGAHGSDGSDLGRVGVVGSGTMATGIAATLMRAGIPAVLVARSPARAEQAAAAAAEHAGPHATGPLTASASVADLDGCALVIEAVAEDLAVKRAVLSEVDRVCAPGTVVATTTSSLPVIDCAAATTRPEAVLGLHFFNPVPAMRLVELVTTARTAPESVRVAVALCERLGKDVVACGDRAGFIVNRLVFPMINDALTAVGHGEIDCESVDAVTRSAMGLAMGPIRLLDVVGADVALSVQQRLWHAFGSAGLEPASALRHLVESGHLGRKSGGSVRTHPVLNGALAPL